MNKVRKSSSSQMVFGIPVTGLSRAQFIEDLRVRDKERCFVATFVNPHIFHIAEKFPDTISKLSEFDFVGCDGIGTVAAARLVGIERIERVSFDFTSLAEPALQYFLENDLSLTLVGGGAGVAERAALEIEKHFSGIKIANVFLGFNEGPEQAFDAVLRAEPGVVLCGMGAPLQEKFLLELRNAGWKGVGVTCGGFFDQISNGLDYYPNWIDKYQLRFAYRIYKEPKRLWRRYFIEYQPFVAKYLAASTRHVFNSILLRRGKTEN